MFPSTWDGNVSVSIKAKCKLRTPETSYEARDLDIHWSFCSTEEAKNNNKTSDMCRTISQTYSWWYGALLWRYNIVEDVENIIGYSGSQTGGAEL